MYLKIILCKSSTYLTVTFFNCKKKMIRIKHIRIIGLHEGQSGSGKCK